MRPYSQETVPMSPDPSPRGDLGLGTRLQARFRRSTSLDYLLIVYNIFTLTVYSFLDYQAIVSRSQPLIPAGVRGWLRETNQATTQNHTIRLICMDLCLHVYTVSLTFKIHVEYLMILAKVHPVQMIFINTSIKVHKLLSRGPNNVYHALMNNS